MISIIITSYNEGSEVATTIESIRKNTSDFEIVLVDDASTDNSCIGVACDQLVRHDERVGIAPSRIHGVAIAKGDCYYFLDAHQRLSEGCANKCAELAMERQAIVWPDVNGLGASTWVGHGANMRQKEDTRRRKVKQGLFEGVWRRTKPRDTISRCSAMVVPGYAIPKTVWSKVKLIEGMQIHGASEMCLCVKAFFTDVDILHLCGPLAKHKFNSKVPFPLRGRTQIRNHALVARVCFDQSTWDNYWIERFRRGLKDEGLKEFALDPIVQWHKEFQEIKCRPDDEFWRGLIGQEPK